MVMRPKRIAQVSVIGTIWMPAVTCAMDYNLSDYDLENIGDFTCDNVEQWLTSHSGDFQSIQDFTAQCGDTEIPWKSEKSEDIYCACMFPSDNE